jgi:nitroimidazol reductase NimA-like FMN-containing flavoprotein (pyridoxamine 5'-phosphate oxidase superfamily)
MVTHPGEDYHELSVHECEELLATVPVGRVGFVFAAQPVVLPVNFEYVDGEILFRTFGGQKFGAAQAHQKVAFEADQFDADLRSGWSVLVKGRAETVIEWDKARAADDAGIDTWGDGAAVGPWVRITPTEITGRRLGA